MRLRPTAISRERKIRGRRHDAAQDRTHADDIDAPGMAPNNPISDTGMAQVWPKAVSDGSPVGVASSDERPKALTAQAVSQLAT